jgi:hypothetical protein
MLLPLMPPLRRRRQRHFAERCQRYAECFADALRAAADIYAMRQMPLRLASPQPTAAAAI